MQQQQPQQYFQQTVRIPNPQNPSSYPHQNQFHPHQPQANQVTYRFHQVRPPGPPVSNPNNYSNLPTSQFQQIRPRPPPPPYPHQNNVQFLPIVRPVYYAHQAIRTTLPTVPRPIIVHPYLSTPSALISPPPIDEDRYTETPMVMPVECELGGAPDTPSTSPDIPESKFADARVIDGTSELLRLQLIDNIENTVNATQVLPYVKRHRRTKKEIIEDRQRQLKLQLKKCSVVMQKMELKKKSVRLFFGGNEVTIKENLPIFPSKMKIVPNKFMKVVNIGCMKTAKGVIYSCMRDHCKFKTYERKVFSAHLLNFHSEEVRIGEKLCGICSTNLSSSTVNEELLHMENIHILRGHLREETILYSKIPVHVPQHLPSTSKVTESSSISSSASDQINKLLEVMPGNLPNININFEEFFGNGIDESGSSSVAKEIEQNSENLHLPSTSKSNIEVESVSVATITKKRRATAESNSSSDCIGPAEKKLREEKRKINTPVKLNDFYKGKEIDEMEIFDDESSQALRRDPDFIPEEDDEEDEEESNISEIDEDEMEDSDFEVLEKMSLVDRKVHKKKNGKIRWSSMMNAQQTNDKIILRIYKLETGKSNSEKKENNEITESKQDQMPCEIPPVPTSNSSASKESESEPLKLESPATTSSVTESEALIVKTEKSNGISKFRKKCSIIVSKVDSSKYEYYDVEKENIVSPGIEEDSNNNSVEVKKPLIMKFKRKNSTEYLRNSQIPTTSKENYPTPVASTSKMNSPAPVASTSKMNSPAPVATNLNENSPIPSSSKVIPIPASSIKLEEASNDAPTEKVKENTDATTERKRTVSILSNELFVDSSDRLIDFGSDNDDVFHDTLSSPPVNNKDAPEEAINDYELDSPLNIDDESQQFEIVDTQVDSPTKSSTQSKGNLVPLYPWCDEKSVKLWRKDEKHLRNLLSESSLVARYKCMSEKCSYYGDNFEEFKNHLISEHQLNKYYICSLCLNDFKKMQDYIGHVKICSQLSKYQCSKCMYRGCEKIYLSRHMKQYHNDCEEFFELDDKIDMISASKKAAKEKLDATVKTTIQRKCQCKLNMIFML